MLLAQDFKIEKTWLLWILGNETPPGIATADVLAIVELESRPSQNQIKTTFGRQSKNKTLHNYEGLFYKACCNICSIWCYVHVQLRTGSSQNQIKNMFWRQLRIFPFENMKGYLNYEANSFANWFNLMLGLYDMCIYT